MRTITVQLMYLSEYEIEVPDGATKQEILEAFNASDQNQGGMEENGGFLLEGDKEIADW